MASDGWTECSVGEIAAAQRNALVGGPFGSDLLSSDYVPVGVPVIRGQNLGPNRWVGGEFVFISEQKAERLSANTARPGDLVFTQRGNAVLNGGQVAIVPDGVYERFVVSQSQMKLTVDTTRADIGFLYYVFKSPEHRDYLRNNAIVTGVPHTNLGLLRDFSMRLPPIAQQRAIANILGALDDKIELNRRMNETLEGLARAIFQSWFVDFDPVRAQRDGLPPPALSPATAALFPDSFEDSELGKIPKGWSIDTIKNRASNVQYGYTQSASLEPVGPRFLRITDIRGGQVDWSAVPFCKTNDDELEKYRIKDGDIFVARTGASTGDNIYIINPPDAVFASYLVRFQFASVGIGRFVGEFMRTPDYFSHVAGSIGGSAQPNASAQTLADATLIFPTTDVADEFFKTVRPLDLKRTANSKESERLATIRDALLPKLLSGEIRIEKGEEGRVKA